MRLRGCSSCPDFMDFSPVEQRTDLATMIGNAVPPIMTMAIVRALIEQGLLSSPATDLT